MAASISLIGSSPRVRGTPAAPAPRRGRGRFIPACAGNSLDTFFDNVETAGSSPRVRGTRRGRLLQSSGERFIPACAGNSWFKVTKTMRRTVHPRVCGELAHKIVKLRLQPRFIPACAGNSDSQALVRLDQAVHPRVCGELCMMSSPRSRRSGSSPRVRGTPARETNRARISRFIPACAGNSAASQAAWRIKTVHPRVCGELRATAIDDELENGSSPRVRGTRERRGSPAPSSRFIPACAGNSTRSRPQLRDNNGSSPRVRGTHFS